MARYEYLVNLSYLWYSFANVNVGSEEIIRNRREISQIFEEIRRNQCERCITNTLESGSRAEGFRFAASDLDIMKVYKLIKVEMEKITNGKHTCNKTFLTMEIDKTRPGFCLLSHRYSSGSEFISNSLVFYQTKTYLSSALWRIENMKHPQTSMIHGPCENYRACVIEVDFAHCLEYTKWPKQAVPCILRMIKAGWPSTDVLTGIVQNGCHLVPIGDKLSDKEMIEWRISFSVAEKTLIHQMHHCQFLCYGMLKIFLKDVIDKQMETKGLICSYFLKTAVLWEIVNSKKSWFKEDFLKWIWICFRRLLSWVKEGYCPNFFIPENNMFMGKIYGRTQRLLLHHLTTLYMEGYRCLPVGDCNACSAVLCQPNVFHFPVTQLNYMCDKWIVDTDLIKEIRSSFRCYVFSNHKGPTIRDISFLQRLQHYEQKNVKKLVIDIHLYHSIQTILFSSVQKMIPNFYVGCNKGLYRLVCKFLSSLQHTKIDVATHMFLSAIFLYRCGMYRRVLRIVINIKKHLQKHNVMYEWTFHADKYKEAGGEFLPVDVMMKKVMVFTWRLTTCICLPELDIIHAEGCRSLYPPMVLLYFLSYMSHYRLGMYSVADSVLNDLNVLVNYDDGQQVPREYKGISWLVLGTCQEIGGYIQDALTSYHNVLEVEANYSFILETALERIENL